MMLIQVKFEFMDSMFFLELIEVLEVFTVFPCFCTFKFEARHKNSPTNSNSVSGQLNSISYLILHDLLVAKTTEKFWCICPVFVAFEGEP